MKKGDAVRLTAERRIEIGTAARLVLSAGKEGTILFEPTHDDHNVRATWVSFNMGFGFQLEVYCYVDVLEKAEVERG